MWTIHERYVVSVTDPGGGGGCTTCLCSLEEPCEMGGEPLGFGPDFDGDGYVGDFDLQIMLTGLGEPGGKADLKSDGIVDSVDMEQFLAQYGQTTSDAEK